MSTCSFWFKRKDGRSGRVAFLIECLLNQKCQGQGGGEEPGGDAPNYRGSGNGVKAMKSDTISEHRVG